MQYNFHQEDSSQCITSYIQYIIHDCKEALPRQFFYLNILYIGLFINLEKYIVFYVREESICLSFKNFIKDYFA